MQLSDVAEPIHDWQEVVEGKDHVGDRKAHNREMEPQEFGPCPITDAVAGISHIVKLHFDQTALLKIEFLNEVPHVAVLFRKSFIWDYLLESIFDLPTPRIFDIVLYI